ncbi:MAG: glycoside hydrolase family 9 protein [Lentisphaeria bacterium]|nr:glycoside hydrolase family 9 protein [Lentisphaeria bacterium]
MRLFLFSFGLALSVLGLDSDLERLEDRLYAVNDEMVCYQLVNKIYKKAHKVLKLENISIESVEDPAYKGGKKPLSFSLWGRPIRYSARPGGGMYKGQFLFLRLPSKLTKDCHYTVKLKDTRVYHLGKNTTFLPKEYGKAPQLSFKFKGDLSRSNHISVNQVGYFPKQRKVAYMTGFAGVLNAQKENTDIDFSQYPVFHIIDAEKLDKKYFSGEVKISSFKDGKSALSESRVWELNFSEFNKIGRFRVYVPGVGVSYPFEISPQVYNQIFGVMMRGMYHQRCGTALTKEWTRHTHPICHNTDGFIPDVDLYKDQTADYYPQKSMVDWPCQHGHHDAGDFGKYAYNGALFASSLLLPFEVYPEKLNFDNSPVPECGNGKADLLEEVKWELDWLSRMQDPDDGGVHIIVKPTKVYYEANVSGEPTEEADFPRRLWWKEHHVTAAVAATLARAARTPAFKELYPEESKQYLKQAEKAWTFCMDKTDVDGFADDLIGKHHYGAKNGGIDDYVWMAIELWLSTGNPQYHDYLEKYDIDELISASWLWSWWPLHESYGMAIRAYVYGPADNKNTQIYNAFKETVIKAADATSSWQKNWLYPVSFPTAAYNYKNWGWFFLGDVANYDLLLARSLVNEEKSALYLEAVLNNVDMELGNNPDHYVAISGVGNKRIVDHVHQNSRFDGIVEPVPGIPGGFFPAKAGAHDRKLPMWDFTYGGAPIMYRYIDAWTISMEFTVPNLATTTMTYAMLAKDTQRRGKPSLYVTANGKKKIESNGPIKIRFEAKAKGKNGKKIREYLWDFNNENFANDAAFNYQFNQVGKHFITCTVTDEDGWISYETVEVLIRQKLKERPNAGQKLKRSSETVAYFDFDNGFTDEVTGAELIVENAKLSTKNLNWMKTPTGQSVTFTGLWNGIQYKFDQNIFASPEIKKVQIDCFVNYESDFYEQDKNAYQFMIRNDWTMILGRFRGQYTPPKATAPIDDELQKVRIERALIDLIKAQPGWHQLTIILDIENKTATYHFAGKELSFPIRTTGYLNKPTSFTIGAFEGYIDELRVQVYK